MEKKLKNLKIYNTVVGLLLLAQGIIMWAISSEAVVQITTSYMKWNEFTKFPQSAVEHFADWQVGPIVATFLILSGLFLLGSAFLWREKYEAQMKKGLNTARWIEYSITSSMMIVVIALLCGVYDLSTLILLFAINTCMILFGWIMEVHNQTTDKVNWLSFIFGCFAGAVPWVILAMYFFNAIGSNAEAVPGFVYAIFWSLLIFFNIFAVNMVLQYKKIGKWKSYVYGEFAYVTLSLVAKALLAWQVWAGTLR